MPTITKRSTPRPFAQESRLPLGESGGASFSSRAYLRPGRSCPTISTRMWVIARPAPMSTSVKGEYALQAIFDLASQRPGEPVKIADIARRQRSLRNSSNSSSPASSKRLRGVPPRCGRRIPAVQRRRIAHCRRSPTLRRRVAVARGAPPSERADTPFAGMWQQVDLAVSEIIDKTTFADLIRRWSEKQNKHVLNWEI